MSTMKDFVRSLKRTKLSGLCALRVSNDRYLTTKEGNHQFSEACEELQRKAFKGMYLLF